MDRRNFIRNSVAGAAVAGFGLGTVEAATISAAAPFKLAYAPHFGMFENAAGKDEIAQLKFMAEQGFTALEDNGMRDRPVALQEKIAAEMTRLGIRMGVFVVNGDTAWKPSLTTGDKALTEEFLKACRNSVEVAKRVNAKWMTVVPGFYTRSLSLDMQTAHVIDNLRRACEIFEPHGLVMVLEPLSDTPELFLRYAEQTFMICKAVNSPSCKLLYDIYHMQRNEGHLIPRIDSCWEEIAYIQIGDNPGRKEPGTGEVNYKNIFKHIHGKGFTGVLGMEHGNSLPGKEGDLAVIKAYRESDSF